MKLCIDYAGFRFKFLAQHHTLKRLNKTCFRNVEQRNLAGNFLYWNSVEELCSDRKVIRILLNEVENRYINNGPGFYSVSIESDDVIGWAMNIPMSEFGYSSHYLRPFCFSQHARGNRVGKQYLDIPAPKTKIMTIAFEIVEESNPKTKKFELAVMLLEVYPGDDFGDLTGDVSKRENRIFFAPTHPGEIIESLHLLEV